jgi:hypothetical protein
LLQEIGNLEPVVEIGRKKRLRLASEILTILALCY